MTLDREIQPNMNDLVTRHAQSQYFIPRLREPGSNQHQQERIRLTVCIRGRRRVWGQALENLLRHGRRWTCKAKAFRLNFHSNRNYPYFCQIKKISKLFTLVDEFHWKVTNLRGVNDIEMSFYRFWWVPWCDTQSPQLYFLTCSIHGSSFSHLHQFVKANLKLIYLLRMLLQFKIYTYEKI